MTDQSALLMDYTIFHIGAYLVLGTGTVALFKRTEIRWLFLPFACFLIAGISGGIIGSNLPDYPSFDKFKDAQLGFWGFKIGPYDMWAHIEHGAFWLGLLSGALIAFLKEPEAGGLDPGAKPRTLEPKPSGHPRRK
jgi:hypothetical protein